MSIIKKMIDKKKISKIEEKYSSYFSGFNTNLMLLKRDLDFFSKNKKQTIRNIYDFKWNLNDMRTWYDGFLRDLVNLEKTYHKPSLNDKEKENIKRELEFFLNKKKEIRQDFEHFYSSFKRIAKGCEDMPMNEILTKMRKDFDFDSTKYNSYKKYAVYLVR